MMHIFFNEDYKKINPILESEIRNLGGEQTNKTNLKCYMTSYRSHNLSNNFKNFGDYVIKEIQKNLYGKDNNIFLRDIWGAIYRKNEYALGHSHSGKNNEMPIFSFTYFVNVTKNCSPLVFPNISSPWKNNDVVIKPENGKLVIFNPELHHYVPPQKVDHERVTIAGNIDLKLKITYQ